MARISAAAIWGLATSASQRKILTELGGVQTLIQVVQQSLKITVVANGTDASDKPTEAQRDDLQVGPPGLS